MFKGYHAPRLYIVESGVTLAGVSAQLPEVHGLGFRGFKVIRRALMPY